LFLTDHGIDISGIEKMGFTEGSLVVTITCDNSDLAKQIQYCLENNPFEYAGNKLDPTILD